jgi:DHA1 family bicyclomycin/chloramphenicol resistance-like MFS transporter
MIFGNGLLAIGASLCVIAPSIWWLCVARFVQGLGVATSAVVVSAIIADVYKQDKVAALLGLMNAVFTVMMALAPILGGFINAAVGWRGNYAFVAILSVASWLLLLFFLPETNFQKTKLDLRKVSRGYFLCLSSLLFWGFSIVPSLLYASYLGFIAIAPFLYMQKFGLSWLAYIGHSGSTIASFAFISIFFNKFQKYLGSKRTLSCAVFLILFGAFVLIYSSNPYVFTIGMVIINMGSALIYPVIAAYSIQIFPDIKGIACSLIMSQRYLICSSVVAIAGYFCASDPLMIGKIICVNVVLVVILLLSICVKRI